MSTSPAPTDSSNNKTSTPRIGDAFNFYNVWLAGQKKPDWVLEGLIQMGDQVILAGAPKTYKSLWGSQFALALALGEPKFLLWDIPKARKVLYVSLEMAPGLVGQRLDMQAKGYLTMSLADTKEMEDLGLYHLFSVSGKVTLNIRKEDFKQLHFKINEIDPDVVIFDSLIRFHKEDENSNVAMSSVMSAMRNLCEVVYHEEMDDNGADDESVKGRLKPGSYRTSLIIHHSRKDSQYAAKDYSASTMRGASSIHSEADLVIVTFPVSKSKEISMNFSARKVQEPEFEILALDVSTLRLYIAPKKTQSARIDVFEERLPYFVGALRNLGRIKHHTWEEIKNETFDLGCPSSGSSLPQKDAFSKMFNKFLNGVVDKEPVGKGYKIRLSEDAYGMKDEAIIERIQENRKRNLSKK